MASKNKRVSNSLKRDEAKGDRDKEVRDGR